MKRLRLGAVLHFLIAIGHIGCLFALDEAFEAYGFREIMHQMVSGSPLLCSIAFVLWLEALAVSMISPGYNVSHPSFPPLSHGATGQELRIHNKTTNK